MSFSSELEAFRTFARLYPDKAILLVDTYDTLVSGVPNAIQVFKEMREQGKDVRAAIRLDSGDLAKLSKAAYEMFVAAGFDDPLIVASNDLDEDLIADLKRQGARINAWGVGTNLITSWNCPALPGVYKLVAVREDDGWVPRVKTTANPEKATDPDRKQVVRYYSETGPPLGDVLFGHDESPPAQGDVAGHQRIRHDVRRTIRGVARSEPLLETVFENGRRTSSSPPLEAVRRRALDQIAALPEEYTRLRNPEIYKVLLSEHLSRMKRELFEAHDQ
jgi:nicotinate phosphoribosyltransferase